MLKIFLPATDDYEAAEVALEHSLVSLSKWEQKYEKAFFGKDEKSNEEMLDYLTMMILGDNPPEKFVHRLTKDDADKIGAYMNSKATATWFREDQNQRPSSEIATSELIYYWMVNFQIPFHPAETWHLNRLFTLIKICGIKQTKPKPMNKQAQLQEYARLNEQRRKQLGTNG